ncbi:uncharacterized protein LOC125687936 [Lagopus muta]|uniref:uncharacterized protein LOC125687936 n=1 Tax=Lagopus muta TaxID=64668 RepID=UPI0020A05E19|nr:uncharacterized protein LOC125687936 [Lagopus muta]
MAVEVDYIGSPPRSEGARYALTCINTVSGLLQAYLMPKANQTYSIKAITKLMPAYRTPQVIKNNQGTHFTGAMIQCCAEENIKWRFHLPYNSTWAGLIEHYNGILKAVLKTDSQSLQGWTKRLCETLWNLKKRPQDGRPSALKMLQTTWASSLRIQITGIDNQGRPQIGNENNLLLSAPENLDPDTHRIKCPWMVQVGPKWCGVLAPWGRLLEVGGSVVPLVIGTWPMDIAVNTPIFIIPVMSIW